MFMTPIDRMCNSNSILEMILWAIPSFFQYWVQCWTKCIGSLIYGICRENLMKNMIICVIFFIVFFCLILRPLFWLLFEFSSGTRTKKREAFKHIKAEKQYKNKRYIANMSDGDLAETECANLLKSKLKKGSIYQSVYIYDDKDSRVNREINECDLIYISSHAIYMIEVKNYGMYIVPNEFRNWQCFPYDKFDQPVKENNSFNCGSPKNEKNIAFKEYVLNNSKWVRSPLKQSSGHVNCFLTVTHGKFTHIPIIPVVVFHDRGKIEWTKDNVDMKKSTSYIICNMKDLAKRINAADKNIKYWLSPEDRADLHDYFSTHTKNAVDPTIVTEHMQKTLRKEGKL